MNKDTFGCCLAFVVSHGVKRVGCRLLRLDLAVPPPLIGKARFVSTEPKQVAPQGRTKRKPAKVSRGAGNQHGLRAVIVHAARETPAAAWTIAAGEAPGCANGATKDAVPPASKVAVAPPVSGLGHPAYHRQEVAMLHTAVPCSMWP